MPDVNRFQPSIAGNFEKNLVICHKSNPLVVAADSGCNPSLKQRATGPSGSGSGRLRGVLFLGNDDDVLATALRCRVHLLDLAVSGTAGYGAPFGPNPLTNGEFLARLPRVSGTPGPGGQENSCSGTESQLY